MRVRLLPPLPQAMRELFNVDTFDLDIILSKEEALNFRRDVIYTPVIWVEVAGGIQFHIMNKDGRYYMEVKEPRDFSAYPHFGVLVSDAAYEELIRSGRCGTRYWGGAKIYITVDNELAEPIKKHD